MKNTDPRGYPYSECAPPLVEDAADIVQLANLALTIDADVTNLETTADNNVMSPDGCHIAAGAQTVNDGDNIVFSTLRFDNSPGSVMNSAAGITTRISGTYLVTAFILTTISTNNLKALVKIGGIGTLLAEGLGSNSNPPVVNASITGSVVFRSPAGRQYQLSVQNGSNTAPIGIAAAEFSVVRLGPL